MEGRTYRGLTSEQRRRDRRERLVAAARPVIGTVGYSSATIEATCRAAGVTARHFYEHFASRDELLIAVYEQVLEEHRGAVADGLAGAPVDDLEGRVAAAVRAALAVWIGDPVGARICFVEVVGVSEPVERRRQQAIAEYTALVSAIADDLFARGLSVRPGNRVGSRAVVGALIGLVELWLTEPEPPTLERLVEESGRLLLGALR